MDKTGDRQDEALDYYEVLQINANADPETIQRVYRFLAQRFHPDNQETGNPSRFRLISEAYHVLSDPERRAKYDVVFHSQRQERWRLVSNGVQTRDDFEIEQVTRLSVLEILYSKRRLEPRNPGIFDRDLEELIGIPREHLDFTIWYLVQKGFVSRADSSRLVINVEGIEFLEQRYQGGFQTRRLRAQNEPA